MIRLLTMSDAHVAVIKRWPPYPPAFAELDYALRDDGWLTEFYGRPHNCCEVALACGDLIGFTMLLKTREDEAEYRIALRADQVGRGHGMAITRMVLERAFAEMGLSRIHLIVRKANPRARRLYEKLGFCAVGESIVAIQGEPVAFIEMDIRPQAVPNRS